MPDKNSQNDYHDLYNQPLENWGNDSASRNYRNITLAGFIWIFMVFSSLIAMVILFKTPYYSYYFEKDTINIGVGEDFKEEVLPGVLDIQKKLEQDKDRLNLYYQHKQDTAPTSSIGDLFGKNLAEDLKTEEDLDLVDLSEDSANKGEDSSYQYQNEIDTSITTILKEELKKEVSTPAQTQAQFNQPQTPKVSEQQQTDSASVSSIVTPSRVWLVSLFSSTDRNTTLSKISFFQSNYSEIDSSFTFYILSAYIRDTRFYRLALAKKQEGAAYYSSFADADSYCKYLKNSNLDCFVITASHDKLSEYIVE